MKACTGVHTFLVTIAQGLYCTDYYYCYYYFVAVILIAVVVVSSWEGYIRST